MSQRHTKKFANEMGKLVSETQRQVILDKKVHIFHIHPDLFKEASFEAGLPPGQYKAIFDIIKDTFLSHNVTKLHSLAQVNKLLAVGVTGGTYLYQKRGAVDFIVISKNYSALQRVFKSVRARATKDSRFKKLDIFAAQFLLPRESGSSVGIDIGHIGTGEFLSQNTPAGAAAQAALDLVGRRGIASGSTHLLTELTSAMNSVAEAHSGVFTLDIKKDINSLRGVIGSFVYTMPQSVAVNQRQLAKIEKVLGQKTAAVAIELQGSPSLLKMIGDRLVGALTGLKSQERAASSALVNIEAMRANKAKLKGFKPESRKIRDSAGRFTSAIRIKNLINAKLHDQIKSNMGSPALNYKSGRFARSAKVTNVQTTRTGMISIFYSYMKNPYQTFEPGYRQGSRARDPNTLISRSVREIAQSLVSSKLRIQRDSR